jgi:ribosomal protein S15P/S13E
MISRSALCCVSSTCLTSQNNMLVMHFKSHLKDIRSHSPSLAIISRSALCRISSTYLISKSNTLLT